VRERTQFLVIGAGPYGLAAAAYARTRGLDVTIVGRPMEAWKTQMPEGMFLRSGTDWHLDALGVHTLEQYLNQRGLAPEQAYPIPLALFRDYGLWFTRQYDLSPRLALVRELRKTEDGFAAALEHGSTIHAEQVLLGLGFAWFRHLPPDLVEILPSGRYSHTSDTVEFDSLRGRRVLIIGGRQSAFEWAALMSECGVAEIHIAHRHATPEFVETDWSWVRPMVEATVENHGWWRALSPDEQEALRQRFWEAGRLKLEPWLAPRIRTERIQVWEKTRLVTCEQSTDGALAARLSDGVKLTVDHVVLATGYRVDIGNITFLGRETLLDAMQLIDGYPALDPEFQTSIPGLYVAGLAATRDFGPFFGFVVGAPVAARIIGDAVAGSALGW
jgi:cation diffusion facilitator CzcD-associated flavoprotein CzcO